MVLQILDAYASGQGIGWRSAAVHRAVRLLRAAELGPAYEGGVGCMGLGRRRSLVGARRRRRTGLMRRGEICLVDLEPARGEGADKRRPAVIVSNDGANDAARRLGRGVITVVPVTGDTERIYPFQVLLGADETGLDRPSKAQAERVRSVPVERIGPRVGSVRGERLSALDEALRLHLAL